MKVTKQYYVIKGYNSFKKTFVYSKGGVDITYNLIQAKLYSSEQNAMWAITRGASGMRSFRYVCPVKVNVTIDDGDVGLQGLKELYNNMED